MLTHKTIPLAILRCVYPAILELSVTKLTVKPTLCEFTNQKLTRRPHVFDRGRYARQAAETVQRIFAAVAVSNRELGTLSVMIPPIRSEMTCTASPTDFNSVVLVVENPISRMITVEKELTTPFGIALVKDQRLDWETDENTHAAKTAVNRSRALGSTNAAKACSFTNLLFLIPVSLPATRLTATRRSRSLRKRAFEGASGKRKKMKKDQRQVAPPSYFC